MIYFASYYIMGFFICMSYIIYKILTGKVNYDIYKEGYIILTLFFIWPIVIPAALFV